MTTTKMMNARLDKIVGEVAPEPVYVPRPPNPHMRAAMLDYLTRDRVRLQGQSAAVRRAMNVFLAGN